MGAGASASGPDLKSKVLVSEGGDNFFIPLKDLASHLRVYQHCTTGEVLVLVDHTIDDICGIIDKPKDWFPVAVCKKQTKYLETLKVLTSLSEGDGVSSSGNGNRSHGTNDSCLTSLKGLDSELSNIDAKITLVPESNRNSRKVSDMQENVRRGKLPPLCIPVSASGQGTATLSLRLLGESNMSTKRLKAIGSLIEETPSSSPTLAENTSATRIARDSDSEYGNSPNNARESPPTIKSPKRMRAIKGLRLDDTILVTEQRISDATYQLDLEVQADAAMIESAAADCCQDNSTAIARLVRENLVYNAESRTHCCQICGDVADDSYPIEQVEEQAMRCITKRELQTRFAYINQSLESSIEIMGELNRFQMSLMLCKAMIMFEKRCTLNSLALALTKKVASIPYYASDGKWLSALEEEIFRLRSTLLTDLREHSGNVNEGGSDREVYEEMKRLYRLLGATVIQIHAKRRALRMFDQYVMGVSDFTFLKKLNTGAYATVFLARRKDTGQYCAIKMMDKSFIRERKMISQVLRERSIMSSIVTSNARISEMFVRMYSAFQSKQSLYIAMEFVQGGDCLSMLTKRVRFPEKMARHCVAEVALALKYLHEHGVVHRDVKPDNVMITVRGHIKLTDFGLAAPWVKDASYTTSKMKPGDNEKNISQSSATGASGFERPGSRGMNSARSSEGDENASASTSFSMSRHSSSSSVFEGADNNVSLSRSTSPKKSPMYDDSPQTHAETPSGAKGKGGVGGGAGTSTDAPSHYSTSSQFQNSTGDLSRSIWLERSMGRNTIQDSADNTSESSLVFRRVGHSLLLKSAIGGNYLYASPEAVMQTGYDHTVDWWAVGVLLFHFLAGVTPFMADSQERSMELIVTGKVNWDALPDSITESAKRLICDLFAHSRTNRLGYDSDDKVLQHEYFDGIDFASLYVGPGPFTVEFCGAGDTRYFDTAPGGTSSSGMDNSREDEKEKADSDLGDEDIEKLIDLEEADDDEFLQFTANPR